MLWCLYCSLWKDSTSFLSISLLNLRSVVGWVYQQRSKHRQVKIMKHVRIVANYVILAKRIKLQHVSNLRSLQNLGFEQTSKKFIEIFVPNNFYRKKTVVKTISVAIASSSDVRCFDLYLINIFTKPTKAERYTDVMFKLAFYILFFTVEDLNL